MTPPPNGREDPGIDPELEALGPPARGRRLGHVALLVAVIGLAAVLGFRVIPDLSYWLSPATPIELGRAGAVEAARLRPNRYARVVGSPMLGRAVRFRRFVRQGVYRVFPLMGEERLLVQVYVAPHRLDRGIGSVEFTGRLVPLARAPSSYGPVIAYMRDTLGYDVPSDAYVLLTGERPSDAWWSVGALLVLVLFIVSNAVQLARTLRRLPAESPETEGAAQAS